MGCTHVAFLVDVIHQRRTPCFWDTFMYVCNIVTFSDEHWWEQNMFCSFTTQQVFWQSSGTGILRTLVTLVLLYSLTQATLMSPWKNETRAYRYIVSKFIYWAFWKTLMRTEYFLFVRHSTSILARLRTWIFEHSGDISCSLLINSSHTDESWE